MASLGILITGFLNSILFIYSFCLFGALFVVYHTKTNGMTTHRQIYSSILHYKRRRVLRGRVQFRTKLIFSKFSRPRYLVLFLPLVVFVILVILFLTHTVFFAIITSDSMNPTVKTGDLVLMHSTNFEIAEGDIIMFTVPSEKNLIIHRVERITEEGIYTAGDATGSVDNWVVNPDDVKAKVTTLGDDPIVLKGVGWYFIDNPPSSAPFNGEMHFSSLMLITLKNIGLILFITAVALYLILTMRDVQRNGSRGRHK